jgi:two-component system, sensor histidine kinase RegB
MTPTATGQMHRDVQGQWVWLDTMTRVRWLAAGGQLAALLLAWGVLDLQFPLGLCLAVVAVSAASNLASWLVFPRSRRLSGLEVFLTLMFDTAQLSLLLFLTGGLHNPFALLLLAPVTVAATTLTTRGTLALGLMAVALASLLAVAHQPLRLPDGVPFLLPNLFLTGFWAAIVVGIAFLGLYSHSVARERHDLAEALLATQMALAREQKLTDLGGVVAAAAHELGTPLATIKLVSSELIDALGDHPDLPADLAEDARLIRDQADRCRTILRSMGRAGKQDLHLNRAPLEALLAEAAAPHADRGRQVSVTLAGAPDHRMPEVDRRPEIIHGLRNLIQNAVDFAHDRVAIHADWTTDRITIRVTDDGPGYPPHLLARIGEPFLRDRRGSVAEGRRDYDGMGLGLFIAKTLLERTGAQVSFGNLTDPEGRVGGARASVRWTRADIEADARSPLGQNQPFPEDSTARPAGLTTD